MGLQACHHTHHGGKLPRLAPVVAFVDPRSEYWLRQSARYHAIDAAAGKESTFKPDDMHPMPYRVGYVNSVMLDGSDLGLEVVRVWTDVGWHMCAVKFSDGIEVKIAQAQLKALLNKSVPVPTLFIPQFKIIPMPKLLTAGNQAVALLPATITVAQAVIEQNATSLPKLAITSYTSKKVRRQHVIMGSVTKKHGVSRFNVYCPAALVEDVAYKCKVWGRVECQSIEGEYVTVKMIEDMTINRDGLRKALKGLAA